MNFKSFFIVIALMFIGFGAIFSQPAKPAEAADKAAKLVALEAKNKEIEKENAAMAAALKAGNDAYFAKRYDEAVDKFSSAANAYPKHPGFGALVLNIALTYLGRGIDNYNSSVRVSDKKSKEDGQFRALADFLKAEETAAGVATIFREQVKDPQLKLLAESSLPKALSTRATALRLAGKIDQTRIEKAIKAYNEYIGLEAALAARIKARLELAQMFLDTGDPEQAGIEAAKVLWIEKDEDNVDALFLVGISYAFGDAPTTKQLGANHLKRFLDLAPANHTGLKDAKAMLDSLKESGGIVPK